MADVFTSPSIMAIDFSTAGVFTRWTGHALGGREKATCPRGVNSTLSRAPVAGQSPMSTECLYTARHEPLSGARAAAETVTLPDSIIY